MKITLTGSLGNISKPLAVQLIGNGHQVTVVSSDTAKKAVIEALGATAAIGSIEDVGFLTEAFKGADVVYTMVPPNFAATDLRAHMNHIGQNYAAAITAAGVNQVVNLSSIGAHLSEGTGPIKGLHDIEGILNGLQGLSLKHLRPVYFFVNLYGNVEMIKHLGFIGANYPEDAALIMVHPNDIAAAAAEEIQQPFAGNQIRYIASDERTPADVAKVLGAAIGKPELKWLEFNNEQAFEGMQQGGLPAEMSRNYVEMGDAIRSGKLWEDYYLNRPVVLGEVKLEQFAVEFAGNF